MAGPIRLADFLPPKLDLSRTRTILHLRDPRDVLVSLYFSEIFSHPSTPTFHPEKDWRDEWRNRPIDDFVLMKAPEYLERYDRFFELSDKFNLRLKTYEEMVLQPEPYFLDVCRFFKVPESQAGEIVSEFTKVAARRPPEDKDNHVRKVTPGDHKEKLAAKTVQELDQSFSHVLRRLKAAWSEAGL
ncbi:sulfotransferase domain-containing protein [Hyphococcus sp.]|uniref:sulfotransferase domain-containing protein n=1 Tax=Hyphococcus sp. TaxID=2038636 RepID=UPI0037534631